MLQRSSMGNRRRMLRVPRTLVADNFRTCTLDSKRPKRQAPGPILTPGFSHREALLT